jgi:hypothetical protein
VRCGIRDVVNTPGLLGSRESLELRLRPTCLWMGVLISAYWMHDFSPGQILCHYGNVSPTLIVTTGLDTIKQLKVKLSGEACLGALMHC